MFLILIILALAIALYFLFRRSQNISSQIDSLKFSKSSQSVKYGKLTEQFIPFVEEFPFAPETFRFMGTPIDGVAFEENKIYLCEFKTAGSALTQRQKEIKQMVKDGKVEWFEFRIG